ncbi:MAG TPA: pantoate--beta-alanine ligase, partial [bacterium]|nr:pantoate--beta-alanine ligase [bacterium]
MKPLPVIRTIERMQSTADSLRRRGKTIGFVPTMGFLHEGHLSLIRLAKTRADTVIVSIFVNPFQFGPEEDLERYPRDFERDEKLCLQAGADLLFFPEAGAMYPEQYQTWVTVENLTQGLCGASRPGHFRGVATVCAKLFLAVKPHIAVFGEKDYQQARVIERMARDLNFDLKIVLGPIVRESDGLAMSSRNRYLDAEERKQARVLNESLSLAEAMIDQGEKEAARIKSAMEDLIRSRDRIRIDYIEIVHPE